MTDFEKSVVNEFIFDYLLPNEMDGHLEAEDIAYSALIDLQSALNTSVFVEPTEAGKLIMENEDEFASLVSRAFDAVTDDKN